MGRCMDVWMLRRTILWDKQTTCRTQTLPTSEQRENDREGRYSKTRNVCLTGDQGIYIKFFCIEGTSNFEVLLCTYERNLVAPVIGSSTGGRHWSLHGTCQNVGGGLAVQHERGFNVSRSDVSRPWCIDCAQVLFFNNV